MILLRVTVFTDFNDIWTGKIEKILFSDSGGHESWTFIEQSGSQILHKYNTFS